MEKSRFWFEYLILLDSFTDLIWYKYYRRLFIKLPYKKFTYELSNIFLPFYQKDTTSFIKYFICIGIFSLLYYINNLWIKKNDQDEKQNQKNIDLDIPLYSNN